MSDRKKILKEVIKLIAPLMELQMKASPFKVGIGRKAYKAPFSISSNRGGGSGKGKMPVLWICMGV